MKSTWLFSRNTDLAVFGGSALFSFAALGAGQLIGVSDTPGWAWIPAVILCDVAHVWSTLFRTYLDPAERKQRKKLLAIAPVVGLAASIALCSFGEAMFWRSLAYLAIFHFVRQQYGWVSLYRAKAGETGRLGRLVDTFAIYAATLYPLVWWHAHLPRKFSWFVSGDIAALPLARFVPIAFALWVLALGAYAIRAASMWIRGHANPGKDLVVVTTALAWYTGIVAFDSDYAFSVTNIFMHGIPYFALIYVQARTRKTTPKLTSSVLPFLATLWAIAFAEELLWDRAIWHDRDWLFGDGWEIGAWKLVVVPLLALPQLTHYVLDGFIWRRKSNPDLVASRHALDVEAAPA